MQHKTDAEIAQEKRIHAILEEVHRLPFPSDRLKFGDIRRFNEGKSIFPCHAAWPDIVQELLAQERDIANAIACKALVGEDLALHDPCVENSKLARHYVAAGLAPGLRAANRLVDVLEKEILEHLRSRNLLAGQRLGPY